MWLTDLVVAAAESTTPPASPPPEIPYETIGLVLVAIVGAISAIIVAVVQRGNKTTPSAPSPTPSSGSFAVSEKEWITVRDRSIGTRQGVVNLREELQDHKDRTNRDIDAIKRKLGM